eukprot:CAMPEP_0184302476 /NCGR_PEP_ID=MMETSP1049-20130417/12443_1 /TAXON_ID=77928 /ORGANISM="Proteomonas sulcata, Strain CCMP704" /LENGTH=40 /DNA_ID= /DNA_START= /DNA_END= /DNA_ORIENTATION=
MAANPEGGVSSANSLMGIRHTMLQKWAAEFCCPPQACMMS